MTRGPISRSLAIRSRVALGVFTLLAIGSLAFQLRILWPADDDGHIVNLAGRQRMLSQRVALSVAQLDAGVAADDRAAASVQLAADVAEMRRALTTLAPPADGPASPLRTHYHAPEDGLAAATQRYLDQADTVLATFRQAGAAPPDQRAAMLAHARPLLAKLDHAVTLFEEAGQDRLSQLAELCVGLFLFSIAALVGVEFTVLRPSIAHLRHSEAHEEEELAERADRERRERFATQLTSGMEMLDTEADVFSLFERALADLDHQRPTELLLADSSEAHLRVAAVHPQEGGPRCSVETPFQCPAVRSGRAATFPSSTALDACPRLAARGTACSAHCVPMTFMGRALGVLHRTGPLGVVPSAEESDQIEVLSGALGARLGSIRAIAKVQLQASTDPLTGLHNRRSLQEAFLRRRHARQGRPHAVALADLDHFKRLNDTHGHDTGDRALATFSRCLRTVVGERGIVGRLGGEEFAIVLDGMDRAEATPLLDAIRTELAAQLASSDLPAFTVSIGVCDQSQAQGLDAMLRLADAALYRAKGAGRDRVVPADLALDSEDGATAPPQSLAV